MTDKKNYWTLSPQNLNARIAKIKSFLAYCEKDMQNLHVSFSKGNAKLGSIPSVSLLPIIDCGNCGKCKSSCYDLRNDFIYKQTLHARCVNSAILHHRPDYYFAAIDAYLELNFPRAFRWHIGGDIKDEEYLYNMCQIAKKYTNIKFLCFTKMFNLVNEFISKHGSLPENLKLIFSGWLGLDMPNPHNLPTAHPIFSHGTSAPDGTKLCTGNCATCLKDNKLCWNLKKGEAVGFIAH